MLCVDLQASGCECFGKKTDMHNFTVLCDFEYKALVKQEPEVLARNAAETWTMDLPNAIRIRATVPYTYV
jgi:hypothetical protein